MTVTDSIGGEMWDLLAVDVDADGLPTHAGLASLLRKAFHRWGIATRRQVNRYLQDLFEATYSPELRERAQERGEEVIERMETVRDLENVRLEGKPHLAKTSPVWCALTEDVAILLGVSDGIEINLLEEDFVEPLDAVVRRFNPNDPETQATLTDNGIEEVPVESRRGLPSVPISGSGNSVPSLTEHWRRLVRRLHEKGQRLGQDNSVKLLSGVGEYFGSYSDSTGRWRQRDWPDGNWCGVRPGYNENHWHPILAQVESGEIRQSIDLGSLDELHWAIIARERAHDREWYEYDTVNGEVNFRVPLPDALMRTMYLTGRRTENSWRWRVPTGAKRIWDIDRS